MDALRHNANDSEKYLYYFNLLRSKINQYSIKPRHTYNMDEKGLAIRLVNRSKRVFSKAAWEAGGKRQSLQDGNREWVTILAAICADGSMLPPAIIYAGQPNSLQSSWMEDLDAGKDSIYSTATPSSYHSSHITIAFINYCSRHKILLLIYLPHSTQTLQPLDVGCFSPFGNNYSKENKPSELPRTLSLLLNVNRVAIEQFCKAIVKDSTSYEARKLVCTFNYLAAHNALLEAEEAAAKACKKAEAAKKKVQDKREKEQQKRKASQKPPTEPLAKKQRARGATQVVVKASPSLTPPPITTRSGRTTRLNRKWEQDKHHRR
ncbi:uncharacterized protein M421DRAFT_427112 [Didymella exigua CBS 183.55]|uniref:DDE-1 domain-containing protein n=1 Tax=Didymella exigua CBS 183.55 TaxID=1150837 RepID=A0A6A5R4C7_9PLEO|nr:uncharacterized protein M421DRAFT_427112 [Didymella exigua CBS 183.55]KAF1922239.1 hypothetical protein M421DRAFT_427112 [Didymella exigua CBS 183.55]